MRLFSDIITSLKDDMRVLKLLVSDTNARIKAAKELKLEQVGAMMGWTACMVACTGTREAC